MASAFSFATNDNNPILHCPIDLSFDLDEVLTTITTNSELPDMSPTDEKIQDTGPDNDLFLSNLPTVATVGVCSVCMEDFHSAVPGMQVPCGHVFHATCIATWISVCNSCPLCRSRCIISGDD